MTNPIGFPQKNTFVGVSHCAYPLMKLLPKTTMILLLSSITFFLTSCNSSSSTDACSPNPCANSPIAHKTACEPKGDTDFTCICESGYKLNVETNLCVYQEIDPCNPNPCTTENQTKCNVVGEGASAYPECNCDDGYTLNNDNICEKTQGIKIRMMAANTTSGRQQSYKPNGIRMFQALKPDIIMIQEFNYLDEYGDSLPLRDLVDLAFGTEFEYFEGSGRIPNGIISRYPIVQTGEWDDSTVSDREIAYAKIKLPNNKFLWVISVHLSTKENLDGARDVIAAINAKNIPSEDYIVLGGDFNTKSRTAGTINELGKVFNVSAPWPKGYDDFSNHDTCYKCYTYYAPGACGDKFNCDATATSYERDDPYDWIVADKDNLHPLQVPTVYCASDDETDCLTFNDGFVLDSRDFTQDELDKYFSPVLVGDCNRDSGDDYMNFQHMGVIKDFFITD